MFCLSHSPLRLAQTLIISQRESVLIPGGSDLPKHLCFLCRALSVFHSPQYLLLRDTSSFLGEDNSLYLSVLLKAYTVHLQKTIFVPLSCKKNFCWGSPFV